MTELSFSGDGSYRTRAESGGRWGAWRSVFLQVASIVTTAVLARILSDEEFGLVAITVVVLTMFDLVTRVGLGGSLVRRDELTKTDSSTILWASLGLGLLAGGLAWGASRPVAALAGSADAATLIALAAITLPLNLVGRVPLAMLSRLFRFRAIATIQIGGAAIHALVAIFLAFEGFGAYSVVLGQIVRSAAIAGGAFVASGFRPTIEFDFAFVREEASFNVGWLFGDLVAYGNKNADYWFVGNALGTAQLGVYYLGFVFPSLLRQRVTHVAHDVIFPVISRIKDDIDRIRLSYLSTLRLVAFVVAPTMLGLVVLADLAVLIGFGDDWVDAIAPMQLVSVAAVITSMSVMARPSLKAIGRPWAAATIGVVSLIALVIGLGVASRFGSLEAVAGAVLGAALVESVVTQVQLKRFLGLGPKEFIVGVFPFLSTAIAMALVVWVTRSLLFRDISLIGEAVVSVAVGVAAYFGIGVAGFRSSFVGQWKNSKRIMIPTSASNH